VAVRVQLEAFDVGAEIERLHAGNTKVGAIASFIGTVREVLGDAAATLTLEHYPGMTEAALADIESKARARFQVIDCLVVHRIGQLSAGDAIVLVAITSAHRGEAFSACEFVMDFLKSEAPFWKKEQSTTGERWVETRHTDEEALQRWSARADDQQG
jgi:molybdopterin synthase catalytic subunit